jgi:endonuclease YncB( thermonuclease family)
VGSKHLKRWLWIVAGVAGVAAVGWLVTRSSDETGAPTPVLVTKSLIPRGTSGTIVATSNAPVARVVDGDTIRLRDGTRVRLLQIDAPERDECYARQATKVLSRILPRGIRPQLLADPRLDTEDDYGRLLAYVAVGGRIANLELVRAGAAVPYFFRGDRGVYADDLLAAVQKARSERRGLWGACPGAKFDPRRGSLTEPA